MGQGTGQNRPGVQLSPEARRSCGRSGKGRLHARTASQSRESHPATHTNSFPLSPSRSVSPPPYPPPWLSKARGLFVPRGQGPGCTHPGGRTRQVWSWARTPHRLQCRQRRRQVARPREGPGTKCLDREGVFGLRKSRVQDDEVDDGKRGLNNETLLPLAALTARQMRRINFIWPSSWLSHLDFSIWPQRNSPESFLLPFGI